MSGRILYVSALAVAALLSVMPLHSQDISVHEKRKQQLEKDIELIDRQLSENESRSRSMLSDLTLIRAQISSRTALVAESNRLIRKYSDEIYLTQLQINRLDARIDTLKVHFAKLVRSAYKNRDAKVWYMYILASENLGQAFRRYSYFRNLSSEMGRQAEEIRSAEEELQKKKEGLQKMKTDAEKAKRQVEQEVGELRAEEKKAEDIVARLKQDRRFI